MTVQSPDLAASAAASSQIAFPPVPTTIEETGLPFSFVCDLVLKVCYLNGGMLGRNLAQLAREQHDEIILVFVHWVRAMTLANLGRFEAAFAALRAAETACPGLRVLRDNRLSPEFLVSLGGTRFTTDPDEPLADGSSLLVMGADVGG